MSFRDYRGAGVFFLILVEPYMKRYFSPVLKPKSDISALLPNKLYKGVKPTVLHSGIDS